jgi:hypothetical protein
LEIGLAKRNVASERCEEIGKSAETTGTRQRFLYDHWFASRQLIIRQLPDCGFKSRPRNQISVTNDSAVATAVLSGKFLCAKKHLPPRGDFTQLDAAIKLGIPLKTYIDREQGRRADMMKRAT